MRKFTPSLKALRAYEAAARHCSFAQAAEELSVTPGAVSQQVCGLEAHLGLKLFNRIKKRLVLTDAGIDYLPPLRDALDRMEAATITLMSHGRYRELLHIGALATLAKSWLIPRLPEFQELHPDIHIKLTVLDLDFAKMDHSPDLRGNEIDVGIFYGDGHWPGLKADHLISEEMIPVASPKLIGKGKKLLSPEKIDSYPLLHSSTRPHLWAEWAQVARYTSLQPTGPIFQHFYMVIEAAIAGLGIALVPSLLIERELARGDLITVSSIPLRDERSYFLLRQFENADDPRATAFCEWLTGQVQAPSDD